MKAWFVKNKNVPEANTGIVWANTRGQAKYKAMHQDTFLCSFKGYHMKYLDMVARRLPEFDDEDGAFEMPLLEKFIFEYDSEGRKIKNEPKNT